MKVLHLNSVLAVGGTDDQCVRLVQGLRELGIGAEIAGPDYRHFGGIVRASDVTLHVINREGPAKLRLILAAAKVIRQGGHDIIHGHHGRDLWSTVFAARLSGRRPKIVLTRHLAKSPSSGFSKRFLLGQIDRMICVSEFVAHVVREGHRDPASPEAERHWRPPMHGDFSKLRVIHGGIDTARFRPRNDAAVTAMRASWGIDAGEYVFAIVGGFTAPRGKGHREFLRAAAQVHQHMPQARFLVIGQGDLAPTLEADIRELGLTGIAKLTGQCSDMPAAMNAIDCLVHPQIGTEAFPGVVMEAHACGRSVVASALDGIPEAFSAAALGQLVVPEDVNVLAEAMVKEARRPPLSMPERDRLHAKLDATFSLRRLAERTADAYRELLAGGPVR